MDIKELMPNSRWPIPSMDQIDRLITQLEKLKEYFVDDSAILKYNTFMYSQMKWPLTKCSSIPSTVTTISKNLWNIVEETE
jgi:hypothetical protein